MHSAYLSRFLYFFNVPNYGVNIIVRDISLVFRRGKCAGVYLFRAKFIRRLDVIRRSSLFLVNVTFVDFLSAREHVFPEVSGK